MNEEVLRQLLASIQRGDVPVDEALERLRRLPFEDLGFAKIDHHREIRCGFPEVVYAEGKTVEQVVEVFRACVSGGGNVLATRVSDDMARAVIEAYPKAEYNTAARTVSLRQHEPAAVLSRVAIVTAGTSDIPVAEEARVTAEIMDQHVDTCYDVGVAGIHRLLAQAEVFQTADVVIAVAGMEGALPSVVGGLVACPVIAVPTSVGYGASLGGLAALLAMLNSCASGITVVNIDNGFGAGCAAARIAGRINRR